MAKKLSRADRRRKVHLRIRGKIAGSTDRPRLCVFRSLKHTYAQLIDDHQGKTMETVSSLKLDGKRMPNGGNVSTAKEIGKAIAEAAKKQGIESVVFDRNGYLYHGRIKALAESVREAGLKF